MKRQRLGRIAKWSALSLAMSAIGVLATLVVAWAIAYRYPNHYASGGWVGKDEHGLISGIKSNGKGIECWNLIRGRWAKTSVQPEPELPKLDDLPDWVRVPQGNVTYCHTSVTGWPWPCWSCFDDLIPPPAAEGRTARERALNQSRLLPQNTWSHAVVINRGTSQVVLPTLPLVRPLLADWGIFMLGIGVPLLIVRPVFRAIRASRGLCCSCAYDRRGLPADAKCPECATVPAPAAPRPH
jgi:hypothetical protein